MPRLISVLLIAFAPALLAARGEDDAAKDLKAMQGKWKTVGLEESGTMIPKDQIPEFIVTIAADGKGTGSLMGVEFEFTMTLDPKKTPKTLTVEHTSGPEKGKKQYGVYKLEGDKWSVCITNPGAAETDRPKDFTTKGTGNALFVFERMKEAKK